MLLCLCNLNIYYRNKVFSSITLFYIVLKLISIKFKAGPFETRHVWITYYVIFKSHTMIDFCNLIVLVYVNIGGFSYIKCNENPFSLYHMVNGQDCLEIPL